MPRHEEIPEHKCWYCETLVDTATAMQAIEQPNPGDLCICFYCGAPGIFDDQMIIVKPTNKELLEILERPLLYEVLYQVRSRIIAKGGKKIWRIIDTHGG